MVSGPVPPTYTQPVAAPQAPAIQPAPQQQPAPPQQTPPPPQTETMAIEQTNGMDRAQFSQQAVSAANNRPQQAALGQLRPTTTAGNIGGPSSPTAPGVRPNVQGGPEAVSMNIDTPAAPARNQGITPLSPTEDLAPGQRIDLTA